MSFQPCDERALHGAARRTPEDEAFILTFFLLISRCATVFIMRYRKEEEEEEKEEEERERKKTKSGENSEIDERFLVLETS